MKTFVRVMKALSDPNRVKMIKMLQVRPLCVCEIREALGIAQSTVSKHLKILEDADLVISIKDGLWVNYSLAEASDASCSAAMLGHLEDWLEDDPRIVELKRSIPHIDRFDICKK